MAETETGTINNPSPSIFSPERMRLIAFFGALCLFFSTLEYLIPKPVPFFRLGLANLPILIALPLFRGKDIVALTVLKVLGQGLVNGTLASYVFLFSLGGSVASALVMYVSWRLIGRWCSLVGVSLLGALASNAVQILLSLVFIFGSTAWVIAPLFMGLGLASGFAVGLFALVFMARSKWYASLDGKALRLPENGGPESPQAAEAPPRAAKKRRWRAPASWDFIGKVASPGLLFWSGILILPAYFFQQSIIVRAIQVLVFMALAVLAGKRLQFGYFIAIVLSVTFFNLLQPAGRLLATIAGLQITEQALVGGLHKAIGIVGLVFLSLATIRRDLRLPGRWGGMLGGLFMYYEAIFAYRNAISRKSFLNSIDAVLFSMGRLEMTPEEAVRKRSSVSGWVLCGLFVALNWALLFIRNS